MNTTEIKARLYDIDREIPKQIEHILNIARLIKEEVNRKDVMSGDFEILNVGIMIEKVYLLAEKGLSAKEDLKRLTEEKKRLETLLREGG